MKTTELLENFEETQARVENVFSLVIGYCDPFPSLVDHQSNHYCWVLGMFQNPARNIDKRLN